MTSPEVIVLVGGTSSLAKALVDQYLLKNNIFKIIITARSREKFDNLYSSYSSKNIEFYKLDVLNLIDIENLVKHLNKYEKKVYVLPKHLDEKVAMLHLEKVGAKLTKMSKEQADYISVKPSGPFKPDTYRY